MFEPSPNFSTIIFLSLQCVAMKATQVRLFIPEVSGMKECGCCLGKHSNWRIETLILIEGFFRKTSCEAIHFWYFMLHRLQSFAWFFLFYPLWAEIILNIFACEAKSSRLYLLMKNRIRRIRQISVSLPGLILNSAAISGQSINVVIHFCYWSHCRDIDSV